MPSTKEIWGLPEDGPEPVMESCIRCKGKGYYNGNGFTKNANRNKGECYLCHGRQEYPSNYYVKCLKCTGIGHWLAGGKAYPWRPNKRNCTNCDGAGYQKLEDPESELRPISCLMCKGLGHYHHKGWCHQGLVKYIKGDCPRCEGKGTLLGNFSRCKRCKGKGAFGKSGILSRYQKPIHITKLCEDCEGLGFNKEEEPVEDDSESAETDEDSDMKNQPEEDVDYGGEQPEDDVNYQGKDESSEEEEDPTPEPEEDECIRCKGKGFYASMGFTTNEKIKKGDCPLCEGTTKYPKNLYYQCFKCDGQGFFSPNSTAGKSNPWVKSAKPCTTCKGKGHCKIDFYTELKPVECPMCKGRGHYGSSTWTTQEKKTKRGDCCCCRGTGELLGNWDKCDTCKGKGNFKGKTAVFCYTKTKDRECDDCDGRGYQPDEDTKKYDEMYGKGDKTDEKEPEQSQSNSKSISESKSESKEKKSKKKEESKEEEPKEEEKEKEEEPEEDDGFKPCGRCGGKGHYNTFGWCDQGSSTKKGDCPLCEGKGKYEEEKYRQCPKCEGKGAFNTFGACDIWKNHWSVQWCSSCNKVGYLSTRPESKLENKSCPMCDGKGHYGTFGFVHQQKRKGTCPTCQGKGEVFGDYSKCEKCDGKGAFNTFGPCEIYKSNKTEDCGECSGVGYTRSEEQDKLEEEEKEKYGYNNKNHYDLPPMPEKPEGADEGCCIIL